MLTILRRRVFVNELLDIAEHLGQDSPKAGQRFIDACEETFAELARMPRLGSARTFDHPGGVDRDRTAHDCRRTGRHPGGVVRF